MEAGAITSYFDVAQVTLYAFWIFFAGLIIYLRREDKREGYPLESDRSGRVEVVGFPRMPEPKSFKLPHGGTSYAPDGKADSRPINAVPMGPWPGAPLEPTGNPMVDGVGPAAYAERANVADLAHDGKPKIVPLRVATEFSLDPRDPNPIGMLVYGADGKPGGKVCDAWVDRSEYLLRYYEVELSNDAGTTRVLLPTPLSNVDRGLNRVKVQTILSTQFADVPKLANPEQVTLLEEDKITAYYGGGQLYATPQRSEPLL